MLISIRIWIHFSPAIDLRNTALLSYDEEDGCSSYAFQAYCLRGVCLLLKHFLFTALLVSICLRSTNLL